MSPGEKDDANVALVVPAQAARAQAAALSPKRTARSSIPSIITGDLVVKGTLTTTGGIQIEGQVVGDVRGASLVIAANAVVQGDITAEDLIMRGQVQGNIRASQILLCAGSHVRGSILYKSLSVEAGAIVEARCRFTDDPLSDVSATKHS